MRSADRSPSFTASFPERLGKAMAEAHGAIAGIDASAANGLLDVRALRSLHEIYRLRVELEIEAAGLLWRTAELVSALGEAADLAQAHRRAAGNGASGRNGGAAPAAVGVRRAAPSLGARVTHLRERWSELEREIFVQRARAA